MERLYEVGLVKEQAVVAASALPSPTAAVGKRSVEAILT